MEHTGSSPLPGNVYRLLIKNVSRDDPLTEEEAQELRAFRATLTAEQWKGWLQFAREEKHAMRKHRKRSSPPKLKALAKDPAELLRTLTMLDGRKSPESPVASSDVTESKNREERGSRRLEVSWSDHNSAHLLSPAETEQPGFESTESAAAFEDNYDEPQHDHEPAAPVQMATEPVEPAETSQSAPAYTAVSTVASDSTQSDPYVAPQHQHELHFAPQHQQQYVQPKYQLKEQQHRDTDGVSLERNTSIGRSSRGRAVSAPRERPSTVSGTAMAETCHNRNVGDEGYAPRSEPIIPRAFHNGPDVTPKHRETKAALFDVSAGRSAAHQASWGPAHRRGESAAATRTEAVDLANASEIARSTALRLDSAYSAAQYLLSTMSTDPTAAQQFLHHHQQPSALPFSDRAEKEQLSVSILLEMMTAMEKSRAALAQLTELPPGTAAAQPSQRYPAASPAFTYPARGTVVRPRQDGVRLDAAYRAHYTSAGESPLAKVDYWARAHTDQEDGHRALPSRGPAPAWQAQGDLESMWAEEAKNEAGSVAAFDAFGSSAAWNPSHLEHGTDQPSGVMSPGAVLSARYAQSKVPGEFSPLNKQLAREAVKELGERVDPVANLQAQLFEASDAARRSANAATVTKAAVLSPSKLPAQYSYNSAGYVWEGVRYSSAQGPVSRICLAHGPLVKAFDDYPVRVDAEARVVDVVWREARIGDTAAYPWSTSRIGTPKSLTSPSPPSAAFGSARRDGSGGGDPFATTSLSSRNTVLRRERFAFDDVFSGLTADGRLAMYSRQRARKALEGGRNLTILCVGCGDVPSAGESAVEPPVRTLLGGGGGTGLISSVVDEIFRYTRPLSTSMQENGKSFPGSFPTANASPFVASKLAFEQQKSKVSLSAVILSDRGEVFDLLATNSGANQESIAASLKRRKSDGRVVLCNASRLQLQAPSDFDRVMGLLLGKRTALQGVLATLKQQRQAQRAAGLAPPSVESMYDILASIDPWAAFNSKSAENSVQSAVCASTMLITVSVSGGKVGAGQTSADFHFVSPCGSFWYSPGADINILAELMSCLPQQPPPSLLKASPVGLLLMDPKNPATDFVNIVTVNREAGLPGKNDLADGSPVVEGALNSLRIIAQLTQ